MFKEASRSILSIKRSPNHTLPPLPLDCDKKNRTGDKGQTRQSPAFSEKKKVKVALILPVDFPGYNSVQHSVHSLVYFVIYFGIENV